MQKEVYQYLLYYCKITARPEHSTSHKAVYFFHIFYGSTIFLQIRETYAKIFQVGAAKFHTLLPTSNLWLLCKLQKSINWKFKL